MHRQSLARIRSDLYSLLSSAYIHLPGAGALELKWKPAAELLGFSQKGTEKAIRQIEKGLKLITPYGLKKDLLDEKSLTNLSRDWTRLLRGVERTGILPPYESLYRTGRLQEKPAQEIHRLFSKMGIRIPDEWHQPPDYIGVELDYMRLLCSREMQAYEGPNQESLIEGVEDENSFIDQHLGAWAPKFCEKMADKAHEDYYRGIARLTMGLIEYDQIHVERLISNGKSAF